MRFSTIQATTLALVGLTKAQTVTCGISLVDFEDLPNVPALGVSPGGTPIPNGYSGLNWANSYGVTPSLAAGFLLPQGKILAISGNQPTTNPLVISATQGRTFNPEAIFIGTFVNNGLTGAAALSTASTVTVTATFKDATTAQTTFNFDPPNTVFGVALNAEAMQYFQFPCEWSKVVSLTFRPQSENGVNVVVGLAVDNFQFIDDTAA